MSEKEKKDDYVVLFKGAKLSKNEANSVGLGIIFGIIGSLISLYTPLARATFMAYGLIMVFSIIGYCLGIKLFKNKRDKSGGRK
jgi:hypothetical protein